MARKHSSPKSVGANPRKLLRMARQFPIEGAWAQRNWQTHGHARILFARSQPNDDIILGQYIVDYFCAGIKDASYTANMPRQAFFDEYIPFFYPDDKPLDIEADLACEIIWGAVEYAERIGFNPPRSFQDASRVLEPADSFSRNGGVEFGYQGEPLYFPFPNDNQAAIIRKLIDVVGVGNFYYMPPGDVPDDVMELFEREREEETPDSEIWTPDFESAGVDAQSGLWIPGQQTEPEGESADAEQPTLWTPGRS